MTYLLHGFGVFLGVLAGTVVTILVQSYFAKQAQTQQTQNLRFELELNEAKIDMWMKELEKYRDAVNGDALHNWFGYFDLGKVISVTASAMLSSGLLYKVLDKHDIASLQEVFHELTLAGEPYMNNSLGEHRRILMGCRAGERMNEWTMIHKPNAVGQVDFWEKRFDGHRKNLQEIIGKLSQKS